MKLAEELTEKTALMIEISGKNNELLERQKRIKTDTKRLKSEMSESIKKVLTEMQEKFNLLEHENGKLRKELRKLSGGKSV